MSIRLEVIFRVKWGLADVAEITQRKRKRELVKKRGQASSGAECQHADRCIFGRKNRHLIGTKYAFSWLDLQELQISD